MLNNSNININSKSDINKSLKTKHFTLARHKKKNVQESMNETFSGVKAQALKGQVTFPSTGLKLIGRQCIKGCWNSLFIILKDMQVYYSKLPNEAELFQSSIFEPQIIRNERIFLVILSFMHRCQEGKPAERSSRPVKRRSSRCLAVAALRSTGRHTAASAQTSAAAFPTSPQCWT